MEIHKLVEKAFKRDLSDPSALSDAFDVLRLLEAQDGFEEAHRRNKEVRRLSAKYARASRTVAFAGSMKTSRSMYLARDASSARAR